MLKGSSDHGYPHRPPPPPSQYLGPIPQMSPLLLSAQPEIKSTLYFSFHVCTLSQFMSSPSVPAGKLGGIV